MVNDSLGIDEPNTIDKKIQSVTATVDGQEVHAEVVRLRGDGGEDFIDGDAANGLDVDVTRSALPAGAATAANQVIEITALEKIDDLQNALAAVGIDKLITIDWGHFRIDAKKAFTTHFSNIVTNINEQTVIAFNAPADEEIHLTITVQSTHNANAFIYRDTSIDVDEGTQLGITCRNQIAPLGTSGILSIETAPVVNKMTSFNESQAAGANITTSTELDHIILPGGGGPKALGADHISEQHWVFSGSVQVAIVLNAETADDATHIIRLDWWEE